MILSYDTLGFCLKKPLKYNGTGYVAMLLLFAFCCEAQGKGRAMGRPRKVTQRSFIDCRLSIIVYFP